jgi:putative ABC transport system substrate-binding protein
MRRRDLLIAVAMVAGISRVAAQPPPAHARVGWLAHGDTMPRHFFDEALARLGWVEGKNLALERRFAGSTGERLAADAAELVSWHPDVIVAMGTIDAYPILALTRAVPIVVVTSDDPVGHGLATSLARPGGNVTGTASVTSELVPKLLELVHELIPGAARVSVLGNPRNPGNIDLPASIGEPLGLTIVRRHASRPEELDAAFAAAAADGDRAMVVQFSALTFEERWRVTALAARVRLPAVYGSREYTEAGGLIAYGPAFRDNFERAAVLVDKILRGASPADLPIEQPTHYELVVNLKTAKALDLAVPPLILARADEIIE